MSADRSWLYASWGALGAAIAGALLVPGVIERVQWLPLVLSLVVFGVPHGAVDHLVPGRLVGRPLGNGALAGLLTAYVAIAGLGLVAWVVSPQLALAVFLTVTILHWGQGDLWFVLHCSGRARPRSALALGLFCAARGALPVVLPVLAFPGPALAAFARILDRFGGDVAGPGAVGEQFRAAGVGVLVALVAFAAAASVLDHAGRPGDGLAIDLAELCLLGVFFATVTPVFAVGLYLLAWHAPRHVVRLVAADPGGRGLRGFARDAAPCTAIALGGVGVLATTLAADPASGAALASVALPLIAALTVPHALVVAWMDHVQGVWRHGGARPDGRAPRTTADRPG